MPKYLITEVYEERTVVRPYVVDRVDVECAKRCAEAHRELINTTLVLDSEQGKPIAHCHGSGPWHTAEQHP